MIKPESDLEYQYTISPCKSGLWEPIIDDIPVEKQVFANPSTYATELHQLEDEMLQEFDSRVKLVGQYLICACGRQRFSTDRRGRIVHMGVRYYYFGIEQQIRKKFSNASWVQHYGMDTNHMYYFQSAEYTRLRKKLVKLGIDPLLCMFIDIAHDGYIPFKATSSRHLWGVWFRVRNINPSVHYWYFNISKLALWLQAAKPWTDGQLDRLDIQFGFRQIISELQALCIPGQPLQVQDAHQQAHRNLYVIPASIMQDSLGRQKIMRGGGV